MEIINWQEKLIPYEQGIKEIICKFENYEMAFLQKNMPSPIESVKGRIKSTSSILEKARRKDIPINEIWNKIEDIAGVRIICRFVKDIDLVVEHIRSRTGFDLTILEEKDYVKNTKSSGYRSYHLILRYKVMLPEGVVEIPIEIQIRTMAMDFWATIEHSLKYKYAGNIPGHIQERLVASANAAFNMDMEMSTIRHEIFEVQEMVKYKDMLIKEILRDIQKLVLNENIELANEYNSKFFKIDFEKDIDALKGLREDIRIATYAYQI
ncbi:MAG: GTP pyrophosphokinase family protein [Lachnospirales bacterium]